MNAKLLNKANLTERRRLIVTGVVQGVGFRPFVYGLARRLELAGFVGNDSAGVFIEIEGDPTKLASFQKTLVSEAPPLAHIDLITTTIVPPRGESKFVIVKSQAQAKENTLISPDISTCSQCLREIANPNNRRYRYPFTNCTNCGPRFSIMQDIPYDRPSTTMAIFPMCPACQAEYDNPLDRRFHAQPNACPTCGPQINFRWSEGKGAKSEAFQDLTRLSQKEENALRLTQDVLVRGGLVAVKGLGGFHLACDARNDQAVQTLRQRKGRVDKPFAVMAFDVPVVLQFAVVDSQEQALLTGKERPIVLLKKKDNNPLSKFIAPGNPYIGVMLPYTPLHFLLLSQATPNVLVMTSGNYSDEPIIKDNADALERLSELADAFLLHNRDIHIQCDDSVVRVFETHELPIRRSRGYAPFPIKLPFPVAPLLAVGGELKSTFCVTKNNYAFMSQHIGDMENLETLRAFEQAAAHFKTVFRVEPEALICDKHPAYLSSKWAKENAWSKSVISVQHHHAHVAAVMAEHRLAGQKQVIGFIFDGTGYGSDGAIWGGEVLVADYKNFERVAHLKYVPLPGGDAAVKRPYRTALAYLWAADVPWAEWLPPIVACTAVERGIIRRQLETGLNATPTSSMGRLFDAVAALVGLRQTVTYEAQAAIELEAMTDRTSSSSYTFSVVQQPKGPLEIDPTAVIREIVRDLYAGQPIPIISAKFHNGVANLILELSMRLRETLKLNQVALSGGVFQNVTLLDLTVDRLRKEEFEIFTHRRTPPNDGGLALGQAIIGSQLLADY